MNTNRSAVLLMFAFVQLILLPLHAQIYDVSRDFSIAANPNGVWSYGWKSTITGSFTRLLNTRRDGEAAEDWEFAPGQSPNIFHNPSTTIAHISDGGQGNFPPGTVWFYAAGERSPQNYCVIRFTVPDHGGGTYLLQSTVRCFLDGDRSQDADYHVVASGQEVFSHNLLPNAAAGYTNRLNLAVGDTVDFMVGRGPDGVAGGSGLKISATLSYGALCTPRRAMAAAQVVNGFVVGATIIDGGCGYTNAPSVSIAGGGGTGATAMAVIAEGQLIGFKILNVGCCYTSLPKIVIASPPHAPTLSIRVSKVKVTLNLVEGRKYVLESSNDFVAWTPAGPEFIAQTEMVDGEFDLDVQGRFFRVREVP